jgi:hypothetical protein
VVGDPALELLHGCGAAEQVEQVLLGADGPLQPPQRVAVEQVLEPVQSLEQLLTGVREPLAERRGLRSNVVGTPGHDDGAVLGGAFGQDRERSNAPIAHHLEGAADLQLLDVLGEVTRRHALVDVLVTRERAELLDAGLHVVAGDAFTGSDGGEVHAVLDPFVVLDDALGKVDAEVPLGAEHGDPQLTLEHDLAGWRPPRGHLVARVAGGEDVRQVGHHGSWTGGQVVL